MMIRKFLERCLLAAILACAASAFAAQQAAPLAFADDLAAAAQTAREKRVPLLLAFMQKTCPYCAISRHDFLEPLQASAEWRDRVIILEVDVDSSRALRDFAGTPTTHREFARRNAVRRVPTLIVFDGRGERAAPPLVGLMSEDFYRLYIEQAIEAGFVRQRRR